VCVQNLKFVALPIPDIIGGTQKIRTVPGYAHAPFSPKCLMGFCSDGRCEIVCVNVPAKFEVCSFTRSWDNIAIGVLGEVANLQCSERGPGMIPF